MKHANEFLKESINKYCAVIGKDPLLVQGAGGNVSWKDGDTLWVKASGTWLADALDKNIFVPVNLVHLQLAINSGDFTVTPKVIDNSELRPSIETLLHALMPHQVVIHLHAIEPLAYLVRNNPEFEIAQNLKTNISWALVSYQKPGEALAKAVADAITETPKANILFLQNHGIVIGGTDIEEVNNILTNILTDLSIDPIVNNVTTVNPSPILTGHVVEYFPIENTNLQHLALMPEIFNRLKQDWVLYPDHVVFLGASPNCYETEEYLLKDIEKGYEPELAFLREQGVYVKSNFSLAKQVQLECYYNVIIRQPKEAALNSLNEKEISDLLNWDAEKYRQQIAK